MQNSAPAIPRLGVGIFNYWNEALHGVASGRATVFPEPIGLGATFDTDLVHRMADAISTEARAKYHEAQRRPPIPEVPPGNSPGRIAWLTYWSPNINIFRDPRWGRGQETYGEDPYLTSRMGVAFVKGMQGNDPKYLKVVATPKHYAVHSGPEPLRHSFDAKATERDMVDTYLPAFKAAIMEGKADSIMCVYNAHQRSARLRQHRPAAEAPARPVGLQGLRGERLRRDRRHLPRPQVLPDSGRRVGGCRQGGHGPYLRRRVSQPRRRSQGGHDHGSRDHALHGAGLRGADPAGHVRSSGARPLHEDSVLRERFRRAPATGAPRRAQSHRAAEEPGRNPAAEVFGRPRSPSSAPPPTILSACWATTTASPPSR